MPELPEVETIRIGLQKYLVGHRILDVEVRDSKIFEGDPKKVIGSHFTVIKRFGKGIVMDLDSGYSIAVHIKLTGQLIYRNRETKDILVSKPYVGGVVPNKFTRVIFKLDKNSFLYFNDVRRFGWMRVIKTEDISKLEFFKSLGPEPLPSPGSNTPKLTEQMFERIVKASKVPIKALLMDQKKIGGIGNIYANDACFDAEIDPRRKAKSLSAEEIKKLYKSIIKVLENGLKYRGATEINFVDALGQSGEYQKHFLVYGREGGECRRCGSIIKKIRLGGRGTYFCPNCQH